MANWIKNQKAPTWVTLFAAVMALVGLIIYIVNSTTGYLGSTQMDVLPVVLTILAILLLAALIAVAGKTNHWVSYIILLAAIVLLAVSVSVFISTRTDVAGDQWYIPGMDTPEKGACLNGSIVGVVFYGLSMLSVVAAAFMGNYTKD